MSDDVERLAAVLSKAIEAVGEGGERPLEQVAALILAAGYAQRAEPASPRINEDHPILKAILDVRLKRVGEDVRDFTTPADKRGLQFCAADDAIIEVYRAVEAALLALALAPGGAE